MPSGDLLAPSLYRENGPQAVRSVIEQPDDEHIVSKFLSKDPRSYITGCETIVLEDSITISDNNNANKLLEFTLPEGSDVISDVNLTIRFKFKENNSNKVYINNQFIFKCCRK